MKTLIYTDLRRNNDIQLGDLKSAFENFRNNKTLSSFILQELVTRQKKVLFNKEISAEVKVGALEQITELMDLFGGGAVSFIHNIMVGRAKAQDKPQKLQNRGRHL